MIDYVLMRDTRPDVYRSGEWGRVVGVERCLPGYPPDVRLNGRDGTPCFVVEYLDGALYPWPIVDDESQYDFR